MTNRLLPWNNFDGIESKRSLLEAAAKAVNYSVNHARQLERDELIDPEEAGLWLKDGTTCWNPLKFSDHAFELLAKLRGNIVYKYYPHAVTVTVYDDTRTITRPIQNVLFEQNLNEEETVRIAIVLFASKI